MKLKIRGDTEMIQNLLLKRDQGKSNTQLSENSELKRDKAPFKLLAYHFSSRIGKHSNRRKPLFLKNQAIFLPLEQK